MCIPMLAWETLINLQFQRKNKQQNLTVTPSHNKGQESLLFSAENRLSQVSYSLTLHTTELERVSEQVECAR